MNTIHENGTILPTKQKKGMVIRALSQQDRIYKLFLRERRPLTPEEVNTMAMPEAPITSARRALTNMANIGILRKCDMMVQGRYGVDIHKWELNIEQGKLF